MNEIRNRWGFASAAGLALVLAQGLFASRADAQPTCKTNWQCPVGQKCDAGKCVPKDAPKKEEPKKEEPKKEEPKKEEPKPAAPAATEKPAQPPPKEEPKPAAPAPAAKEAVADEKPEEKKDDGYTHGGEHRVINTHAFITPTLPFSYSAITNGYFSFTQGFGVYSFERVSAIDGSDVTGSLFLYGQAFQGSIGILNRVAIDLHAKGLAAVGGDLESVLFVGALADVNVGALPKVRIFTLDSVGLQTTVGFGVFYNRVIQVIPQALIDKSVGSILGAGKDSTEGQFILQVGQLRLAPALMIAEGIHLLGVQLSVSPQFGVAGDDPLGTLLAFGSQLELDFYRLGRVVPIAITGEYQLLSNFAAETNSSTFGGGVYYSGRRDFNFGGTVALAPAKTDSLFQGSLVMQYYF